MVKTKNAVTKADWYHVAIACAGVYGSGINPYGSNNPSSITTYDKRLEVYYCRLIEGGMVMDKRPAFERNERDAIHGVVSGPMLNMTLPEGTGKDWTSGFDTVARDVYADYWRKLGARIGYRRGDTIVWEDGAIDTIAQYDDWGRPV